MYQNRLRLLIHIAFNCKAKKLSFCFLLLRLKYFPSRLNLVIIQRVLKNLLTKFFVSYRHSFLHFILE